MVDQQEARQLLAKEERLALAITADLLAAFLSAALLPVYSLKTGITEAFRLGNQHSRRQGLQRSQSFFCAGTVRDHGGLGRGWWGIGLITGTGTAGFSKDTYCYSREALE